MNANSFSRQGLVSWRKMFGRQGFPAFFSCPEHCLKCRTRIDTNHTNLHEPEREPFPPFYSWKFVSIRADSWLLSAPSAYPSAAAIRSVLPPAPLIVWLFTYVIVSVCAAEADL